MTRRYHVTGDNTIKSIVEVADLGYSPWNRLPRSAAISA
jgi:hypothetical protein